MAAPSVSQIITGVTLQVTSASTPPTVTQTFNDSATLASLKVGITNSIPITNAAILSRYATPGLQCSNVLSITYGGLSSVSTPISPPNFIATPITLSNFGPFTYNFVSGGTFTLPPPTSNSNSPGTFSYSVNGTTGIVSISGNVVTMLAPGSTTIRAIQNAAGGYASSTPIDATLVVVAPVDTSLYSISNPTFRTPLSGFPRLGAMTKWEMNIKFNIASVTGDWRAIIGDSHNSVNPGHGWGLWLNQSGNNGFYWGWKGVPSWNPSFTYSLNKDYIVTISKTPSTLTILLKDVGTGQTQTASTSVGVNEMSTNGPVTVGGWVQNLNYFSGTIAYVTVTNPDAGITTFTTTNLLARYDASVASTSNYILNGSNDVTMWKDLTGNGYNLIQNGTRPMPTPTAATINSLPALNFNPLRGLICSSVPLATNFTIFMVVKYNALISTWGNFMHQGNRDMDWSIRRNDLTVRTSHNIDFISGENGGAELTASTNTNYIIVARYVTNTVLGVVTTTRELWLYSDTVIPLKTPPRNRGSVTAGNKPLYVGRSERSEIAEGCNSNIGEILYYSASLTDADVAQNVAYLQNKWFNYKQ